MKSKIYALRIWAFSIIWKDNHLSKRKMLWPNIDVEFYSAAMSKDQIGIFTLCVRFDNLEILEEKETTDKFVSIKSVGKKSINTTLMLYTQRKSLNVIKLFLVSRGYCPFRLYIFSNPVKHEFKLVILNYV